MFLSLIRGYVNLSSSFQADL